jgi:tetratricopeptide (TPR) repeat protein
MTDTKKFLIMTQEFLDIYVNAQVFAKKLGCPRDTSVNNWVNGITKTIRSIYKTKMIDIFEFPHDFWLKEFNREDSFRNYLRELKENRDRAKEGDKTKEGDFDHLIVDKLPTMTIKEREMLKKELDENIDLEEIRESTPTFMFKYAEKLRKDEKINEALEVLKMIENHSSSYKSTYYNQIEKLKALLLADDKIKDWDGAIDILKRLYSSAKYHKEDPEITTLIASNYKRKAFYSPTEKGLLAKEKINVNLLISAIAIHKESYRIKDSKDKYYDAINMAYLYNILNAIEIEEADTIEVEELYAELSKVWKINDNDWWAVVSNSEFLMLLGKVDLAILKINDFLEFEAENLAPSDIKATFRQLEIYIHFTQDENAIKFYNHLKECWMELTKS